MIQPNVTLTPAAQKFIRRMVAFSETPAGGMRLVVAPGGCSGYSAEFTVIGAPLEGDSELPVAGTRLYLPAQSRLVLDGATVDFADTPTKSGFVVTHPDAAACGCSSAGEAAPPAQATVSVSAIARKPSAAH